MKAFKFEINEIRFVNDIHLKRAISTPEAEKVLEIYKERVHPDYAFCPSCPDAAAAEFNRLYRIMCQHLGVDKLSYYINNYIEPVTETPADKDETDPPGAETKTDGTGSDEGDEKKENETKSSTDPLTEDQIMKMTNAQLTEKLREYTGEDLSYKTRADARKAAFEIFKVKND